MRPSHLKYLSDNGYTVIPLRRLVDYRLGKEKAPPPRSVVITADDGHRSVYEVLFPLVKKYSIPVTLFIYLSATSKAPYAMTWEQLREMKRSGLIEVQSHSYWHPNFVRDRKRMSPRQYEKAVEMQLGRSKERLEKELGGTVDMLAWPFGIYDGWLIGKAREAGYVAGFTLERRTARNTDDIMTIPRYLLRNADRGKRFAPPHAKGGPTEGLRASYSSLSPSCRQ